MPASKVVDHTEVQRWFEQGVTYPEMVERYREKYNIETGISMWGNYARRRGLRRAVWDPTLVPWKVRTEHKSQYPYQVLTQEARRRAGNELTGNWGQRVDGFKRKLAETSTVVHYDPEVSPYFHIVPRREGIDTDMVRVPEHTDRREPDDQ